MAVKKVIKVLDRHFEEVICVFGFAFFIVVSNIQVFTRLIPWVPVFPWTEELSRYSFVWVMFLGVSWALREAAHLKVDILVMYFSKWPKKISGAFANIFILAFSVFVGYYGVVVVTKQIAIGQRLTATGLPMWMVTLCFATSCTLTAFRAVQRLVIDWRGSEEVFSEEEKAVREADENARAAAARQEEKEGENT